MGKEELAQKLFNAQAAYVSEVTGQDDTGKTVAFFYINSSGSVVAESRRLCYENDCACRGPVYI
jgi:hypothetical protein